MRPIPLEIVDDLHAAVPEDRSAGVRCPGEGMGQERRGSLAPDVPVDEGIRARTRSGAQGGR
jgi:hypothetical protein